MSSLENLQYRMNSFKSAAKSARRCFFAVILICVVVEAMHQFGGNVSIRDVGQPLAMLLLLFVALLLIAEMGSGYIASKIRDEYGTDRQ